MKYDYIIVGAGFFGAICAYELNKRGYKILVVEKRNHIGGNCFTEKRDGIDIHTYGPHIFHTNDEYVWNWINQFVSFNDFSLRPVANYDGEIYSLPFSMWTFSQLWGVYKPEQAKKIINEQSAHIINPKNLEEQAIKLVGQDVYDKLIKGYTTKQWRKSPAELPASIIKRLPVRFTYDNNYFNDKYQGIPENGYTEIFERLLEGIEVRLGVDFFQMSRVIDSKIIYTGPIDKYFNYQYGRLEYKTARFEHKKVELKNYQGTAMMNFTSLNQEYTRIIEHKHFSRDNRILEKPVTWITEEYPKEFEDCDEPMYPVNDVKNNKMFREYKNLALKVENVYFGGRLAEYKYYDMHQVIARALTFINKLNNGQ
jgi:UDP-galactopyranose mutase